MKILNRIDKIWNQMCKFMHGNHSYRNILNLKNKYHFLYFCLLFLLCDLIINFLKL